LTVSTWGLRSVSSPSHRLSVSNRAKLVPNEYKNRRLYQGYSVSGTFFFPGPFWLRR
jgi:hypothetical protein